MERGLDLTNPDRLPPSKTKGGARRQPLALLIVHRLLPEAAIRPKVDNSPIFLFR
jgi:hypothetical protein